MLSFSFALIILSFVDYASTENTNKLHILIINIILVILVILAALFVNILLSFHIFLTFKEVTTF